MWGRKKQGRRIIKTVAYKEERGKGMERKKQETYNE